jgi:hypothetical protein
MTLSIGYVTLCTTSRNVKQMPILFIGETETKRIAEIVAYAKAHPVTLETLRAGASPDKPVIKLEDRKPGMERPPSQHMIFPGGYRAAYSIEEQPTGLCSHLSISVMDRAKPGMMPSPEAVKMIAEAFGVPFPDGVHIWSEEFDPGEYAVNIVALYAPKPEGHT